MDLVAKYFPDVVSTATDGTTLTAMSMWAKVVYSLFGVAGIWVLAANLFKCRCCKTQQQ